MILSLINKKGGVGKTSFAFSIAKDLDLFLQSNDNSIIESIYKDKAQISNKPELMNNCVYDFGGFVADGILDIIKNSDLILIPCTPLYNAILRTIETIKEILEVNKRILILITDYQTEADKNQIQEMLEENYTDLKFFYFKHSKILENSMRSGASFRELTLESALSKISYANFFTEYQKLLSTILKGRNHD